MNKKSAILAATAEYYGRELTGPALKLYEQDLADLSAEDVAKGLGLCRNDPSIRYMPTAGQIREKLQGSIEARAIEAWDLLLANMDPYATVVFSDPRLSNTVSALGGWLAVCNWTDDEIAYRRREFLEFYKHADDRDPNPRHVGMLERDNQRFIGQGYRHETIAPVKMIGDEGQCRRLLAEAPDRSGEVIAALKAGRGAF